MLGTDEEAVLRWPVVVVSRVLPVVLLATGVAVPALLWSRLPSNRPGPLSPLIAGAVVGTAVLIPQMRRPLVTDPEVFEGPLQTPFLRGVTVAWVRAKFGPLAMGNFILANATGLSVGLTVTNFNNVKWHVGLLVVAASVAGSFLVGVLSGVVLRRYGRSPSPASRIVEARTRPGQTNLPKLH
ncbi:MAG TPA: hypothetical protein VFV02_10515 [Acidimicrobiales bacterium]|nr:hypothetical protein [Acidimicrobiales bacterium]